MISVEICFLCSLKNKIFCKLSCSSGGDCLGGDDISEFIRDGLLSFTTLECRKRIQLICYFLRFGPNDNQETRLMQ